MHFLRFFFELDQNRILVESNLESRENAVLTHGYKSHLKKSLEFMSKYSVALKKLKLAEPATEVITAEIHTICYIPFYSRHFERKMRQRHLLCNSKTVTIHWMN